MGFDFGDLWNPVEQFRDLANKGSSAFGVGGGGGDAGTYANVRGPDGKPVQVPSTYGQLLSKQTGLPPPVTVSDGARQALLAQQAGLAGQFADQAQQGYNAYGTQGQTALDALHAQMQGRNSVSAEQLRQGLAQQLAQQRSFAAGGPAGSAAMRARTAAIQMGRSSTAMAGQQSLAGLQERNQATSQYGSLLGTLRGQDLSAATQSRQNAMSGYGASNTGAPQKDWEEKYGPAIAGAAAAAASDRRLKTDIKPGDDQANAAIAKLQPYTYGYKDPAAYGTGQQLGTTTQDLARAGLQQAIIKTPAGEMVDAGKLSGANTAMIAALGRRVEELEGGKPTPPMPSMPRSPMEEANLNSPAGRKQGLMSAASKYDPQAVGAQEALDRRRAQNEEFDLRRAGAYPDTAGGGAQADMDRRRAVMAALARSAQVAQGGR